MKTQQDRARTPEEPPHATLDAALRAVAARPAPANGERLTREVRFHFAHDDIHAPLLLAVNAGAPASAASSLADSLLVHLHKRCNGAVRTGEDIDVDEAYAFAVLLDLALALYNAAGENA